MPGQQIRRSQFVTTFGPGAVLEGPNGPRVINALDRAGIFDNQRPVTRFEITDVRLSAGLLRGAGIVSLPSNAELGLADAFELYRTDPFPSWALCIRHRILYRKSNQNNNFACPRCPEHPNRFAAYQQVRKEAIRFVRACPAGHLDDVDWPYVVRLLGGSCVAQGCRPTYFRWENSGGALRQITIVCPHCGGRANLGTAYSRDWPCSGRFPEMGATRPQCPQDSKIIQRGAANLFMPELVSALTIPPRASRLHRLLEMQAIRVILQIQSIPIPSKARLLEILDELVQRRDISQVVRDEIDGFDEQTLLDAIRDIRNAPINQTDVTLRRDEFTALQSAATNGYPRDPQQGAKHEFEVVQNRVRLVPGPQGRLLRITPVSRLRVVMVQTGYRRLEPLAPPVDRAVILNDRSWYPGVELFGEGVYVDLAPPEGEEIAPHFQLHGVEVEQWLAANGDQRGFFRDVVFPDPQWTHPVFVWWHTLSHRLIAALSLDCGYSSAALRERVFISTHPRSGALSGGVLIYTAQPGGDGTLGGLIAMVPSFERVLRRAFLDVDSCSNDPLCSENNFARGKVNGPACYSCLLQSETSCEHRNMLLDRSLLLNNLP